MSPNCNFMRPLARDESAVFLLYLPTVYLFLSRLFAQTKQLRPTLYLAGGCNYLRWETTALCCTGWDYTLRASG